jgi:sugar lactone lactonase YvrE
MATKPSGATSMHAPGVVGDITLAAERILADGLGFLEGPRWHRGELWFSDFFSRRVSSVDLAGVLTTRYYVPGQPSGLAPLPDGDVLVASVHNGRLLRGSAGGALQSVADIGACFRGALNDLVVDTNGRAYVSTLPDLTGGVRPGDVLRCPIILVDEHGEVRVVADDLRVPNGMVITADGRTLIAAETQGYRLIKFDVAQDGSLGAPEVFAELGERKPDGIALDPTGAVWVCCPFTSEVLLVAEEGAILASASTPGSWAVACAVGGELEDTLFVVTAKVTVEEFHAGTGTGAVRAYRIERR